MRNKEQDESWLREVLRQLQLDEPIYISANHYDGGYEVRVGSVDVFVDYESIDKQETFWLAKLKA